MSLPPWPACASSTGSGDGKHERQPVDINHLVEQLPGLTRARWKPFPQQHGIVIEMRLELTPALPAIARRGRRNPRGADQPDLQCGGRHTRKAER